jgi:predicted metal-binding membrane protein
VCSRSTAAGSSGVAALTFAMWCAMVLAMMLPSAAPMIATYADLAETAAAKGEPAASPLVLTAGYIAVWLGAAFVLTRCKLARALGGSTARWRGEPVHRGRDVPRRRALPVLRAEARLRDAVPASVPLLLRQLDRRSARRVPHRLRQGLYCLGCCWAMMLLMFAVGVMNVVWMAALGSVMTIEKLGTTTRFQPRAGVVFIAIGLVSS